MIAMFRLASTENTMQNINPFYIQKALDSIAGQVKNASRLKEGTPLVDVSNEKQANVLLKNKFHGSYPIQMESRTSLNSCHGVVTTNYLDGMTDEEIQSSLVDKSVSEVYWLIGKINSKPFLLSTVFLTFEVPTLPSTVHIGYEAVSVQLYVPNPMCCFRCQKFGHMYNGAHPTLYVACVVRMSMVSPYVLIYLTVLTIVEVMHPAQCTGRKMYPRSQGLE
jgi:hypothetical protein